MEIKKDNLGKVAPIKKEKPEMKIEKEPVDPVPPINEQKEKAEKPKESVADIKAKREKINAANKERVEKLKVSEKTRRKNLKITTIVFLVTFLILFLFTPIYPIKNQKMSTLNYLTKDDLSIAHPLEHNFSLYQFFRFEGEVSQSNEYIESSKVRYSLKDQVVRVRINEYKPLAKDHENNVFFYVDDTVVKRDDISVYAPVVNGFSEKTLKNLLENLNKLDYSVIQEIDTVTYAGTDIDPDLLNLGMDGGHTIIIEVSQIPSKLPYYNQMKQIIDEKADGKPGIIHLNIGDYYEPKE